MISLRARKKQKLKCSGKLYILGKTIHLTSGHLDKTLDSGLHMSLLLLNQLCVTLQFFYSLKPVLALLAFQCQAWAVRSFHISHR